MASRHISQKEAHRLRKRVEDLERAERLRLDQWGASYPGGVNIETLELCPEQQVRLDTVARLEHIMVGKLRGSSLMIYAINPLK